jgi:hypothetical protein
MKLIRLVPLFIFLILFSISCGSSKQSSTSVGAAASTPSPELTPKPLPTLPPPDLTPKPLPTLPQPPVPLITTQTDPEQQAGELADAIASAPDNNSRLAAWLGVYQAVGLPVINENGSSVTNSGDDPLGPPYWLVWYFSVMDIPGRGISLADASHVLTAKPDGSFDSKSGQILLNDLRQLINSNNQQEQLLGYFIREQILRSSSKVDLMDPAANSDEMGIDVATGNLLQWVLARNMLYTIARSQSSTNNNISPVVYELPSNYLSAGGGAKCSELMGSETSTTVIKWMLNKLNGGLEIPLVGSFKGTVNLALEQLGASADLVKQVGEVKEYIKTAMSVYSFAAQMNSMVVEPKSMNSGGLVRSSNIYDGETDTIQWHLFYDRSKLPDGDDLTVCMINYITSTYGDFTIPTAEDIKGAEISLLPGQNMPSIVKFNETEYTMSGGKFSITTGEEGIAELHVIGVGQKKNLPSTAKPVNKTYSIYVSAQPEGITAKSIYDQFMSSLAFWKDPGAVKLIEPVLGLLKTFHYDLGEYQLPLTDWFVNTAYRPMVGKSVPNPICDFEKSFEITINVGMDYIYTFAPAVNNFGTVSFTTPPIQGAVIKGSGTYELVISEDVVTIIQSYKDVQSCIGGVCYPFSGLPNGDIILMADPNAVCPEPK